MTTNDQQRALVPRLRFPEFRDASDWKRTPLRQVLAYERPDRYTVTDTNYVDSGTPVLTANKSFILGYTRETDGIFEDAPVIIFDDFTTDRKFVDFPFKVKSSAIKILKSKSEDKLRLVYELMHRIRFDPTQHKRYYISQYQHLDIPLPDKSEQQKIADCLGSLDDLIAAQRRKLAALRDHKKGLMQQLFPREGETRPRLRFPEFLDAGEWNKVPLGELVDIASGQVDPTQPPFCDLPHVGSDNIESDSGYLSGLQTAKELRLVSGKYSFDQRDILYSKIRPALNKVAAPTFKGICSADIYPIRPSIKELRRDYLYYLLFCDAFLAYAVKHSARSKIPKLNRDALMRYQASVPIFAEQRRIADCLSTLDAQITAQAEKLDALRTHKRGVMQQLFPSPEDAAA